jgi:hypothetical protein
VHHHHLRLAAHHREPVRHGHGGDLVRHGYRRRHGRLRAQAFGVRIHDWAEISAPVAKEVANAARGEQLQVQLGGGISQGAFLHSSIVPQTFISMRAP